MNKYQEAYGRVMSRAYRYTNPEGVYVDLEVLGELVGTNVLDIKKELTKGLSNE